jgi:hypothetical protein
VSRRQAAVFAQSSIVLAINSIANPHLNEDHGAIIALPGETAGVRPESCMLSKRVKGPPLEPAGRE